MSIETIEQDLHRKVSQKIRLSGEGDRFRVLTPFRFDDGDHLSIVLKKQGARWVLSDEAHTFMHLNHDIDEKDLHWGTRQTITANALSTFGIEYRVQNWCSSAGWNVSETRCIPLFRDCSDHRVAFLSRERVRCTFMEDFRALLSDVIPEERRTFDWSDPAHDPHGMDTVDCRINGMSRPLRSRPH